VDPLDRAAVARVLLLEVSRSVERPARPAAAVEAQEAAQRRDGREQGGESRDADCEAPREALRGEERLPRQGSRDGEEKPCLEVELEDRVHPVPDEDELAARQDREAESGERERRAEAGVRRAPERRPESDETGGGGEEAHRADLAELRRMEREGHERQRERDRREDQERAPGPPKGNGAGPPRHERERHEQRDEESPHVEEIPRLRPRTDLTAPVPRGRREARPERTREERGGEGDPRNGQDAAPREREGRGGESRRPRPEPESAGQEKKEARVDGRRPPVRDLERAEEESGERNERSRLSRSEGSVSLARHEKEKHRDEGCGERQREDVCVQVRVEKAPERVLADRVWRDDARRGPEVMPVERAVGLMELEVERGSRAGGRRHEEREKHRDCACAQTSTERGAGGEDRGRRQRRGHCDREIEKEAWMDAEKLAGSCREEVAKIRVRERRAGEPRLRRRQLRGPEEGVQEREVHRLLTREDLRVQRAHGEEEEKRAPENERRLSTFGCGRRRTRAAAAEEAGREERGRRDEEKATRERSPAPRDEEPRQEGEEEDTGDAPEGVAPRARREQDGEEACARKRDGLEPYGEEQESHGGRALRGDTRARFQGRGRRGHSGRRPGRAREQEIVARQGLRRRG